MVLGENLDKFGEFGVIRQSFTHKNLYHKTAGRMNSPQRMNTEHIAEISCWTCMAKPQLAHHFGPHNLRMYPLDYPVP